MEEVFKAVSSAGPWGPVWKVVGAKKDGLLVRKGEKLASPEHEGGRLAHGSLVVELTLKGERLRFLRLTGDGPQDGWVSIKVKGNDMLIKCPKAAPHEGRFHVCCLVMCESGHLLPTLRIARALASRDSFWRVSFVSNTLGFNTVSKWLQTEPDKTGKIKLLEIKDGTTQEMLDDAHVKAQNEDGSGLEPIRYLIGQACPMVLRPLFFGEDRVSCFLLDGLGVPAFAQFLVGYCPWAPVLKTTPLSILAQGFLNGMGMELLDASKAKDVANNSFSDSVKSTQADQDTTFPDDVAVVDLLQSFTLPPSYAVMLPAIGADCYPVGLIADDTNTAELPEDIKAFIEKEGAPPVVYVSMGSQASFTKEQLEKFLEGLKSPEWRVIWALRQAQQDLLPGVFDKLGENFMVMTWAPQLSILHSEKVIAFVSHCGWGASIEACLTATPVVGFPMFADQPLNSLMFEWFYMGRTVGLDALPSVDALYSRAEPLLEERMGQAPRLRDRFTTEMVREAILDVVTHEKFRNVAGEVLAEVKRQGSGAQKATDAIETYCNGKFVRVFQALTGELSNFGMLRSAAAPDSDRVTDIARCLDWKRKTEWGAPPEYE